MFVAKADCLHIDICFYHDPFTEHAPLPPLESPAQIIDSVIPTEKE